MYTRRVNKKQFFHPSALCRTLVLILEGLLMLFFRLWVMNFDGPVFTKIDNPAAFADRFVTRVSHLFCLLFQMDCHLFQLTLALIFNVLGANT